MTTPAGSTPEHVQTTARRSAAVGLVSVGLVAATLLALTAALWLGMGRASRERNDFTTYYASAMIVRDGRASAMYDPAAEASAARLVIGGGSAAPSLTTWFPPAVLLVIPLTFLPLGWAFLVWTGLQLCCLLGAGVIAARAAPWPPASRGPRILGVAVALAGVGTLEILTLGQWDGIPALGLALAYLELRRGRDGWATTWVVLTAVAGKPHLAAGLILFLSARRPRSLGPASLAALVLGALTLLVVPPHAWQDLLATVAGLHQAWPTWTTLGIPGLASAALNHGRVGDVAGDVATVAALVGCGVLGRRMRSAQQLDPAFLGVTLLSLLAIPHVYPYDLALLIPGVVGLFAWACRRDAGLGRSWPGPTSRVALLGWLAVTLVGYQEVLPSGSFSPTPLLPVLLVLGTAACLSAHGGGLPGFGGRRRAPRRRADEAWG
jgi:glycosyl transferase family 87